MTATAPYKADYTAKRVMGFGQQVEAADRVVTTGHLSVTYVEAVGAGWFYVNLNDGSLWKVPPRNDIDPEALYQKTYTELTNSIH